MIPSDAPPGYNTPGYAHSPIPLAGDQCPEKHTESADQADVVKRFCLAMAVTDSSPERKRLFVFLHRQAQRLRRSLILQRFSFVKYPTSSNAAPALRRR